MKNEPEEETLTDAEALDRLISSAMDDAATAEEHAALRERIAEEPEVAARVRAFHDVDAALRGLARAEAADPTVRFDVETGLDDLESRLGLARSAAGGGWRRAAAVAFAAAAAFLLYAQFAGDPTPGVEGSGSAPVELVAPELDPILEEELSIALGYGDDLEGFDVLPDVSAEDLDVVDQLELLDYLAEQGWEGRG